MGLMIYCQFDQHTTPFRMIQRTTRKKIKPHNNFISYFAEGKWRIRPTFGGHLIYRTDTLPDGFITIGLTKSLGVIIER